MVPGCASLPAKPVRCSSSRWVMKTKIIHRLREELRRGLLVLLALVASLFLRRCTVSTPQRILIIKPDHLGDVLLATPAIQYLRHRHPYATLVAMVGPWASFILRDTPALDALLPFPFPGFDRSTHRQPLLAPYWQLFVAAKRLYAGRFDVAIILRDDHWWGAAMAMLAGIPCRVGYEIPACCPFLTTALPWHPDQHVTVQGIHLAAAVASDLPIPASIESKGEIYHYLPLVYTPTKDDQAWATTWLHQHGIVPDKGNAPLVVLHPGTGGATKLWLTKQWAAVCQTLRTRYGVQVVVTGGPGEEALVQELCHLLDPPPPTMVGEASVGQLTALLGKAALVMGVDSGPLHLAVSQRTPTLHLYGPSNIKRFGPWGEPNRHLAITSSLWCSPCGVFDHCPRQTHPPACMGQISVMQVTDAAEMLLEQSRTLD